MALSTQQLQQVWQHAQHACFVYDLDALDRHLQLLSQQQVVKLWYAVKANPLSAIVERMQRHGIGYDVASKGELQQVLRYGQQAPILNTGPAKSLTHFREFLAQGVRIFVLESRNQLHWLAQAAAEQNVRPQALLRVQLSWQNGERNPLGGHKVTPFGLACEQWQGLNLADYPQIDFCGLHIFQWGNMLDLSKLSEIWQSMLASLMALATSLALPFKILDLGGGLGLSYTSDSSLLPWSSVVEALAQLKRAAGIEQLWMELGRYAVGPFGHYLVDVVDRKQNFDREQLILSAGVNHLLRPALTNQAFPVKNLSRPVTATRLFQLHGPLCTAMDDLGAHPLPIDSKVGDVLQFDQVGAYGFSESMPYFLCHHIAAEYVVEQGRIHCLREALAAESYLR